MNNMKKYAAVIAAAGLSSRMGDFKPLLRLNGETMISRVVRCFREADVSKIVVVTGYQAEKIEAEMTGKNVIICKNPDYRDTGMFESLCMGIRILEGDYTHVFLTPGDVPLVLPETLRKMKEAHGPFVRPVYNGKPGHPVLLSAELTPAILQHDGSNGLRGALSAISLLPTDIAVADIGVTLDADTPDDFRVLQIRMEMSSQTK